MSEKISVVVPVYNTAPYLEDFFSRLVKQTFQDYKAYLVYDISSDNSLEILQKYEAEDTVHFEILYSPKKDGLGAARDFALDSGKIRGDYVLFLDPDDYPEHTFLERLYQEAKSSGADITLCGFERFDDESGEVLCTEMVNNPTDLITDIPNFDLLAYMNPVVWDKLYKRDLVENLRFTNIKRTEDVFWLLRMVPNIKSIKCINESLYHYRVRDDSLLNSINEKAYKDVVQNFCTVSKELDEKYGVKNKYRDVIDLIGFSRCGIGITYRAGMNDLKNAKKYARHSRKVLDQYYPGWRKNRFLTLKSCSKHGIKGLGIWGCHVLYRINRFDIYIRLYTWFKNKFKKEIKW